MTFNLLVDFCNALQIEFNIRNGIPHFIPTTIFRKPIFLARCPACDFKRDIPIQSKYGLCNFCNSYWGIKGLTNKQIDNEDSVDGDDDEETPYRTKLYKCKECGFMSLNANDVTRNHSNHMPLANKKKKRSSSYSSSSRKSSNKRVTKMCSRYNSDLEYKDGIYASFKIKTMKKEDIIEMFAGRNKPPVIVPPSNEKRRGGEYQLTL